MSNKRRTVIVQKWEESERSGDSRPDGFSLHLTEAGRKAYIKEYWDRMPEEVPACYSKPSGTPYKARIGSTVLKKVKTSRNGFRSFGTPPGSGGTDGWIRVNGSMWAKTY